LTKQFEPPLILKVGKETSMKTGINDLNKKMKVLLLANPDPSHTLRWARSLSRKGIEIGIFCINKYNPIPYKDFPEIQIFSAGLSPEFCGKGLGGVKKIAYLKVLPYLKKVIRSFKPDIVHSHYISSYGLLGSLSGFHPYISSVWGSDIYDVPKKSIFHRLAIKWALKKSDLILSTSHAMAKETRLYTKKNIIATPFGIDLDQFQPCTSKDNEITIGTVKKLAKKYGIEYLIEAFKLVKTRHPELNLKLLLVGGGHDEKLYQNMVKNENLEDYTVFTGSVPFDQVPAYHNKLDVYVALSSFESFGVAILEASACEKPVVVSDVGGLPEVVEDGVTGFVVPRKNPEAAADAIEKLVLDKNLRFKLGKAGRRRVLENYDWNKNVDHMIAIYRDILKK
jgi:glycosyltransferase involved in cell wall biosynthesis